MLARSLIFFALIVFTALGEDALDPWEHVEDEQEIVSDEMPFDPVEEMRKLWEQEMREGEDFKDGLREMGVNVEEWEQKFGQPEFGGDNGHGHQHGEL
eukprot:GFUD01088480.1.p1 GENE.GFUD01088480.1~~GFUD01088480.1.p1  ORF type:complete len:112 (+),score=36.23 GFUD01088480.1:43-336(+)